MRSHRRSGDAPGTLAAAPLGLAGASPRRRGATRWCDTEPDPRWHRRWQRRMRHSLGLRLIILFLALALAISMTFLFGMQRALGMGWRDVIKPLVADYVDRLAGDLGSPPDIQRAQALTARLPLSIEIDGPVVHWRSPTARPALLEEHPHELLIRTTADGHRIRFGLDTQAWMQRPRMIGWMTLTVLLMLTALAWKLAHHLFGPLKEIGAGVERFGRGDFSQPIQLRRHDELGELAEQVNTMAADLSSMLDAKRALLLAISHELRSPLTRARLNAELVPEGPERDALLRDLAEMRDLITSLLESERLAQPHAALQREPTDLAVLVAGLQAGPFIGKALAVDLPPDLPSADVDRTRLGLLLRNLIDNALRHATDASAPPELQARFADGVLTLSVRDHGPGVPADVLARLAEPFYRADAARQRATGGVGLGLYLCRLIAQAHGGSLQFESAQPGLKVVLRMPWGSARAPKA
ncbi:HAMP domain-containing sensor histidine kinase [Ideonella sp. DXS29W]|uniref:histidine kinase n=1 Tax=Ideonella lacteola TaxID=2984193 RepID=A0ABU9BJ99_9BURK